MPLIYPTLIDVEALVIAHLLADSELDSLVEDRISSEIPSDPVYPRVRIQRIGGRPDVEQWLDRALIQADAYADTRDEAWLIIAETQRALHQMRLAAHELGVVTSVETDSGPIPLSDPDTDRPRYELTCSVHVHPPTSSSS